MKDKALGKLIKELIAWVTLAILVTTLLFLVLGCKSLPQRAEPAVAEPNNIFEWTPEPGQAGEYEVTFSVSDGNSVTSETITITVLEDVNFDGPSKWLTRTEDRDVIDLRYLARLRCPQ